MSHSPRPNDAYKRQLIDDLENDFLPKALALFPENIANANAKREKEGKPLLKTEPKLNPYLAKYLTRFASRNGLSWGFNHDEEEQTNISRPDITVYNDNIEIEIINESFDSFYCLEAKRLPAGKGIEEKEYVNGKRGGIQRFKESKHGTEYIRSGLVAYVQNETFEHWLQKVNSWIEENNWLDESLNPKDEKPILAIYTSTHNRMDRPDINLTHFWIKIAIE